MFKWFQELRHFSPEKFESDGRTVAPTVSHPIGPDLPMQEVWDSAIFLSHGETAVNSRLDGRIEEYRGEAARARQRAANSPASRDAFLRIAEDWEALAREVQHVVRALRDDDHPRP